MNKHTPTKIVTTNAHQSQTNKLTNKQTNILTNIENIPLLDPHLPEAATELLRHVPELSGK